MSLPPPIPSQNKTKRNFVPKLLCVGAIAGLLMIAALITYFVVDARESYSRSMSWELDTKWGGDVIIDGAFITDMNSNTEPEEFICNAGISSQTIHRNRFSYNVFDAEIDIREVFCNPYPDSVGDQEFRLILFAEHPKNISADSYVIVENDTLKWDFDQNSLYRKIDLSALPSIFTVTMKLFAKGTEKISVSKIGDSSSVTISGNASNPSFGGNRFPDEREISGDRFSGTWNSNYKNETYKECEVSILVGVDTYRQVSRTIKYAVIIILLTFSAMVATEALLGCNIPVLNYLLVGIALILFYYLLLSFAEYRSFTLSYIVAATMTIGLISVYIWKMCDSRKAGLCMAVFLCVIYTACLLIISLENLAFMMGSLLLFVSLAAMMYVSLKIRS